MIAIKQANTEFNPQEQLLKRKHLQESAQLISKNAFPSLSTYFTLISRQQQAQTAINQATLTDRHPHHHHQFIHTRIRWCDRCLASCSISVKMKTHQVLLTCQRPTCRKRFIQPLSTWSRVDQPSESLIKEQPPPTNKKLKTETETSHSPQPTTGNSTSLEKTKSSSSKKSKNRPSRSALNDLLARRKQADEQASSKNNLQNFLTQL
ncbi:hypothetical protein PGTUg99_014072 [Puccinia graminis f. sp. tritici]|nr:hypothetical protein PGTUg99_014072 [Puccinia graminis f. sp. tritici]